MGDLNFIYSGVIVKEGDEYLSHCLDLDVSSSGTTIEEAKNNLVKALSGLVDGAQNAGRFFFLNGNDSGNNGSVSGLEFILEKFYFSHNMSLLGNIRLLPAKNNGSAAI